MNLIISFRGTKTTIPLVTGITVEDVKTTLANSMNKSNTSIQMTPNDIKLIHRGKVLQDPTLDLSLHLNLNHTNAAKKDIKLMAMGISSIEQAQNQKSHVDHLKKGPRIRDDLSSAGKLELRRRRQIGRQLLHTSNPSSSVKYGFHRIETLPMLPNQSKAKEILTTLANDPGIQACMAKHQWHVGCLAELYPEGKVGESSVCVMGLNQNKGQKILLRLRTDDLKGFRKILSIRKVLFHELSHNEVSEHNQEFFQLMRQVERECNEMDWTQGNGRALGGGGSGIINTNGYFEDEEYMEMTPVYRGAVQRLGGGETADGTQNQFSRRELAARAALRRMTVEEEEIQQNCGCGQDIVVIDNPTQSQTTFSDINELELTDPPKKENE